MLDYGVVCQNRSDLYKATISLREQYSKALAGLNELWAMDVIGDDEYKSLNVRLNTVYQNQFNYWKAYCKTHTAEASK